MANYFTKFPQITYQIGNDNVLFTNILFRVKVINELKNNIYAYIDYLVPEGDTIEATAEKYYGDPEAHWVIILANTFVDPLFDWPLKYDDFNNFIASKYGSVQVAQSQIDHYELKKTYRTGFPPSENIITTIISESDYNSLPENSYELIDFGGGVTVEQLTATSSITSYDQESLTNEAKRAIKLIKKDYYSEILNEFQGLVKSLSPALPYIRTLKNF